MSGLRIRSAQILAEIVRLQRWAGGDAVDPSRIFGLMHGFESVISEEVASFGVSAADEEKIRDLLEAIEDGRQSPEGMHIKSQLRELKVDESTARNVMEYFWLGNEYGEALDQIANAKGSFASFKDNRQPEDDWFGSLHYCELVDTTEGAHRKLHAVFTAAVPQVGDFVTPQNGPSMRVVSVDYVVATPDDRRGSKQAILIPHVMLEAIEDDDRDE